MQKRKTSISFSAFLISFLANPQRGRYNEKNIRQGCRSILGGEKIWAA
jgi:hypothetical protein